MSTMADTVPCLPPKALFHPIKWLQDGTRDTSTSARDNCPWSEVSLLFQSIISVTKGWPKEDECCVTKMIDGCRSKLILQWFKKTMSWWFLQFLNTQTRVDLFSNWQHCHKSLFSERDTKPEIKSSWNSTPTLREYWYYLGVRWSHLYQWLEMEQV